MAKKLKLEKIYPRDVKALESLARCGHVSYGQLREFVRDKRLTTYTRAGLVEKVVYSRPGEKARDMTCYKLTPKGREFCRDQLSMSRAYLPQSPSHDLALSDRYFSLTEAERATWRTEAQCRDMLAEHLQKLRDQGEDEQARQLWDRMQEGRLSMPDGVYTSAEGMSVAVEIITGNYGQAEIESKEEAAEALGASLEMYRA